MGATWVDVGAVVGDIDDESRSVELRLAEAPRGQAVEVVAGVRRVAGQIAGEDQRLSLVVLLRLDVTMDGNDVRTVRERGQRRGRKRDVEIDEPGQGARLGEHRPAHAASSLSVTAFSASSATSCTLKRSVPAVRAARGRLRSFSLAQTAGCTLYSPFQAPSHCTGEAAVRALACNCAMAAASPRPGTRCRGCS